MLGSMLCRNFPHIHPVGRNGRYVPHIPLTYPEIFALCRSTVPRTVSPGTTAQNLRSGIIGGIRSSAAIDRRKHRDRPFYSPVEWHQRFWYPLSVQRLWSELQFLDRFGLETDWFLDVGEFETLQDFVLALDALLKR